MSTSAPAYNASSETDHVDRDTTDEAGSTIIDAASLRGLVVVNSTDEELGTIETIMLDVPSGRIAYAVLSFGGFFGMGNKLFAMPWAALTLDAARKRFILDVRKELLESAPGFDKNHWPRMADREWAIQLHAYYDAEPYWDDTLSASSG
jgi:sporulation protein YlmC with PRC-barrel domain